MFGYWMLRIRGALGDFKSMHRISSIFMAGVIACFLTIAPASAESQTIMEISVEVNGKAIAFELNDSQAARDLYGQLPQKVDVENFGGTEKIFYPSKKLGLADTPMVKAANVGTLAYYAPWGNVVMFYGKFGSAPGLYELGKAVSGKELIQGLSGSVYITQVTP